MVKFIFSDLKDRVISVVHSLLAANAYLLGLQLGTVCGHAIAKETGFSPPWPILGLATVASSSVPTTVQASNFTMTEPRTTVSGALKYNQRIFLTIDDHIFEENEKFLQYESDIF